MSSCSIWTFSNNANDTSVDLCCQIESRDKDLCTTSGLRRCNLYSLLLLSCFVCSSQKRLCQTLPQDPARQMEWRHSLRTFRCSPYEMETNCVSHLRSQVFLFFCRSSRKVWRVLKWKISSSVCTRDLSSSSNKTFNLRFVLTAAWSVYHEAIGFIHCNIRRISSSLDLSFLTANCDALNISHSISDSSPSCLLSSL